MSRLRYPRMGWRGVRSSCATVIMIPRRRSLSWWIFSSSLSFSEISMRFIMVAGLLAWTIGLVKRTATRIPSSLFTNRNSAWAAKGFLIVHCCTNSENTCRSRGSRNRTSSLPITSAGGYPENSAKVGFAYRMIPFCTMRMLVGEFSVSCRYFIMLSLLSFSASFRALMLTAVQLTVCSSIMHHERFTQQAAPPAEANRVSKSAVSRFLSIRSRKRSFSRSMKKRSKNVEARISCVE